ncbi:MAG: hypothetical protein AAF609_01540 [Cyanobacteria bacterium P01_C01_bin.120]
MKALRTSEQGYIAANPSGIVSAKGAAEASERDDFGQYSWLVIQRSDRIFRFTATEFGL